MPFDKRAYMREYMRRKRAEDPSYGQPSSKDLYEEEYDEKEEYELPQISVKALIVIIIGISLGLLGASLYFKFFHKEPEEKELTI